MQLPLAISAIEIQLVTLHRMWHRIALYGCEKNRKRMFSIGGTELNIISEILINIIKL